MTHLYLIANGYKDCVCNCVLLNFEHLMIHLAFCVVSDLFSWGTSCCNVTACNHLFKYEMIVLTVPVLDFSFLKAFLEDPPSNFVIVSSASL